MDNKSLDILSIISVLLGYENLIENRQQSAQNDVQSANDKQAKELLLAINEQFDAQNEILQKILKAVTEND